MYRQAKECYWSAQFTKLLAVFTLGYYKLLRAFLLPQALHVQDSEKVATAHAHAMASLSLHIVNRK